MIFVVGGLLGIVFGLVLLEIIGFYLEWVVSWLFIVIVLLVFICLLVGVGFGVFLVIKVLKFNLIDVLYID